MISLLGAAVALGFMGSLHCVFMCGPLAVAGCASGPRSRSLGLYLGGRLVAYAFAGAIFGALGARAGQQLSMPTVQHALVLVVAAMAVAKGLSLLFRLHRPGLLRIRRRGRWESLVVALLPRRALPLGLATGALPCGLLAGAWAFAAATGHPAEGAMVLAAFWAATTPALLLGVWLSRPAHRFLGSRAWSGVLWCAFGLFIGARPLLEHLGGGCH